MLKLAQIKHLARCSTARRRSRHSPMIGVERHNSDQIERAVICSRPEV
jgi:hypothetical protein